MRDSETYNRSATIGTAENRNRKTVVRIQSTKKSIANLRFMTEIKP